MIPIPDCEADEHEPKAIISMDQSRVDIEINQTKLNFATVTGSVFIELNETEHGFLWLYAEAEDFNTVIAPSTFRIDSNTSTLDFTVDTYIPNGHLGGEVRTLKVYGNITLSSDNSSIHPVEPVYSMISINPVWSLDIEIVDPIIEVPPGQTGTFKMKITNNGHQGQFDIQIQDLKLLQENEYIVKAKPSHFNIDSGETVYVNISVDLPDFWTLWADRVDSFTMNVTDENGKHVGGAEGYIKVEGIYLGGMEGIFCTFIVISFILLILLGISDLSSRGTKEEREKVRELKKELIREFKIRKKEAKMRKKGIFLEDEDNEKKETEPEPEPAKCPYCDSTDIKTTLSGKLKCKDCERIIDEEGDE
jgi:hypothetical protein